MKFLLVTHMNPEETRQEVMDGHADFIAKIRASGE
ncbi:hypothetical protein SAMN05421854_11311 [Amycolatopsis rubida]|uniref:Uncharacterized protein n=1 Tax=Amycolatopsis rubida TaxID=112413 RepID=A0A1I5YTF6_9PSEU|nr:hypothetical protein SAMN05421854_11311 [Amycolatopsis rubida]